MPTIMQIAGFANGEPCGVRNMYVYDVQVQRIPKEDWLRVTRYEEKAYVWATTEDAFASYLEVLKSQPVRKDGQPNRPMTALSVVFIGTDREPTREHPPL
jgi:hypothetical protein